MKSMQSGFTLIELIIVIVILGVLAALAVPRFVNLQDDSQVAALNANAAALASAMNINYAACAVKNHVAGTECLTVNDCGDGTTLLNAALPTGYSITAGAITGNGVAIDCSLVGPTGTATFKGVGAGQ